MYVGGDGSDTSQPMLMHAVPQLLSHKTTHVCLPYVQYVCMKMSELCRPCTDIVQCIIILVSVYTTSLQWSIYIVSLQ